MPKSHRHYYEDPNFKRKPRKQRNAAKKVEQVSQPKIEVEQPAQKKMTVEIDVSTVLLFVKHFMDLGIIKPEDLTKLLNATKEVDFKLVKDKANMTKGDVRALWLYQMRNHELFCDICGHPIESTKGNDPWRLTYDHRQPRSKGGKTDGLNASPAHSICNGLKTNYLPNVWEQIGFAILSSHGIHVDFDKCAYDYRKYLQHTR